MNTLTYSEKLRDPRWQKKRLSVLKRDKWACTMCGDKQTELQVHHLKYTGEPHEAPLKNLKTLCRHCHYIISVNNGKKTILSINRTNRIGGYCFMIVLFDDGVIDAIEMDKNSNVMNFLSFSKNSKVLERMYYLSQNQITKNG